MTFRSLLIGLGQIGLSYDLDGSTIDIYSSKTNSTHAKSIFRNPHYQLCAGIDPCDANRLLFTSTYKLPAFDSLYSASLSFDYPCFDIVTIAVPPSCQFAVLKQLLAFQKPHVVLLEKPICGLTDDLDEFLYLINQNSDNVKFLVNYQRNFLPILAELAQLIASGSFGRLIHGNLFYGKGLLMNGSHYLSLLISLLGDIATTNILRSRSCIYNFDREVDMVMEFLRYPGAQVYLFSVGHYSRRMGEFDLIFENARVRWADSDLFVEIINPLSQSETADSHLSYSGKRIEKGLQPSLFIPNVYDTIYRSLHDINQNEADTYSVCTFHHGLKTFRIVKSALQQL